MSKGVLYVVATPIGNLADLSARAVDILNEVDWIAAEDTRQTEKLCQRYNITTRKFAYHQHNENSSAGELIRRLGVGESGALVSDAGTPLISDPGYAIVRQAHRTGIQVVPIPGACSAITALCASGLSSDRFTFIGFLPPKSSQRIKVLSSLNEPHSYIFFESPNRVVSSITDMQTVFGSDTEVTIARELTKQFEQIKTDTVSNLLAAFEGGDIPEKGEFVLILEKKAAESVQQEEIDRYLKVLLEHLSPKQASECSSKLLGVAKNLLYKRALYLKSDD